MRPPVSRAPVGLEDLEGQADQMDQKETEKEDPECLARDQEDGRTDGLIEDPVAEDQVGHLARPVDLEVVVPADRMVLVSPGGTDGIGTQNGDGWRMGGGSQDPMERIAGLAEELARQRIQDQEAKERKDLYNVDNRLDVKQKLSRITATFGEKLVEEIDEFEKQMDRNAVRGAWAESLPDDGHLGLPSSFSSFSVLCATAKVPSKDNTGSWKCHASKPASKPTSTLPQHQAHKKQANNPTSKL